MNDTTNASANVRYGSNESTLRSSDDWHALQTYLSDALALERHIAQPLARQREFDEAGRFGDAVRIIAMIKSLTDAHVKALEAELETAGGHAASPIKSAWAQLLGAGAAVIDGARKTKVSKSLRDDYTALSLASISYTMLLATALALGDRDIASLAQTHLEDYARMIMAISDAMPAVVLEELRADGENVRLDAVDVARQETKSSWKSSSPTV